MASGSFTTSTTTTGRPNNLLITWSSSGDVSTNTTTVNYSVYQAYNGSTTEYTAAYRRTKNPVIKIKNNANSSWDYEYAPSYNQLYCYTGTLIMSGSATIANNNDGSLTLAFYAEAYQYINSFVLTSGSSTAAADTIARASDISLSTSSLTISQTSGTAITATINKKSSGFTTTLTYTLNGSSTTLLSKSSATSASVTYAALLSKMSNVTSGTAVFTAQTYNGSTLVGSKTASCSISINTSVIKPSLSIGALSLNSGPSGLSVVVSGYSTVKATFTGTASTGSSISSYSFSLSDGSSVSYSGSTVTSGTIKSSSTNKTLTLTGTCKDARGVSSATATCSATIVSYGYSPPVASASAIRTATYAASDTTEDAGGEYLYITYSGQLGTTNISGNTVSTTATLSSALYDWTAGSNVTTLAASGRHYTLSSASSVTVTVKASDKVTSKSVNITVPTAVIPLELYDDHNGNVGVGLAKVAEAGKIVTSLPMYDFIDNQVVGMAYWRHDGTDQDSSLTGQLRQLRKLIDTYWDTYIDNIGARPFTAIVIVYGGNWTVYGAYANSTYGSFFAHSYGVERTYHLYKANNVWYTYEMLKSGTAISVSSVTSSGAITGSTMTATKYTANTANDVSVSARGQGKFSGITNTTANQMCFNGALQLREAAECGTAQSNILYAPAIGFHWGGRTAKTLALGSDGVFYFINQNGTTPSRANLYLDEGQGNPTIWTGTCQGGSYVSLDVSAYSGLWIYFMHYLVVSRTYLDLTKASAGNDVDSTYVYNTGASTGYYVNSRWECHYAHFGVPSTKNQVKVLNAGYTYNSTNGLRNSNANYYMYRIDGVY